MSETLCLLFAEKTYITKYFHNWIFCIAGGYPCFIFKSVTMKAITFSLLCLFIINTGNGQKNPILIRYDFTTIPDSTNTQRKVFDNMNLIIWPDRTEYYSQNRHLGNRTKEKDKTDGLTLQQMTARNSLYMSMMEGAIIIREKDNNSFTVSDRPSSICYYYRESLTSTDFKWKLIPAVTKEFLGIKCNKATGIFKGREYTAWYAPTIPTDAGPYKFFGLPGLILAMNDTDSFFTFKATEINSNWTPDENYLVPYKNCVQVEKKDLEGKRKMRLTEPAKFLQMEKGVTIKIRKDGQEVVNPVVKPRRYNFLELID